MLTPLLLLPLLAPQDLSREENYRLLENIERTTPVVRVVQAVTPAVVFIETEYTQRGRSRFWGAWEKSYSGSGSGVVVHVDGYVVTNYHVVKGAETISVSFDKDPEKYPADLVSFVQSEDLALLKIKSAGPFEAARMGTSSDLLAGEQVVAIGNPYGQNHTVYTGIISGLHRGVEIPDHGLEFSDLIQTDASINFGNSGGPLLNIRGELIGINTAMNSQAENIGFAIPVDRLREVLTDILYPQARNSWLGFRVAPGDTLLVSEVWPDGPASQSGICEGDRILAIGGKPVKTRDEFLHASLALEPHKSVLLSILSEGERQDVKVGTWDRFDGLLFERLGITVSEIKIDDRSWVLVDRISDGSPAQALGLQRYDLIPSIKAGSARAPKGWRINSKHDLARLVQELKPGAEIRMDVVRDKNEDKRYDTRTELYKGWMTIR